MIQQDVIGPDEGLQLAVTLRIIKDPLGSFIPYCFAERTGEQDRGTGQGNRTGEQDRVPVNRAKKIHLRNT